MHGGVVNAEGGADSAGAHALTGQVVDDLAPVITGKPQRLLTHDLGDIRRPGRVAECDMDVPFLGLVQQRLQLLHAVADRDRGEPDPLRQSPRGRHVHDVLVNLGHAGPASRGGIDKRPAPRKGGDGPRTCGAGYMRGVRRKPLVS